MEPSSRWSIGLTPCTTREKLVGAVVTFLDITERKQAESEIHILNAELEQRVIARTTGRNCSDEPRTRNWRRPANVKSK